MLITGVGIGAVGLEIFKALRLASRYVLYGVDASRLSLGLYLKGFQKTFVVPRANDSDYISRMLEICKRERINAVAPGSEAELFRLTESSSQFDDLGVRLMTNNLNVIRLCSDKAALFDALRNAGIPIPQTNLIKSLKDVSKIHRYPCVVKPSVGSGGSRYASIVEDASEAKTVLNYLLRRGIVPLVQEYMPVDEGEFTVGIVTSPNSELLGSIAMKRSLDTLLSYSQRYNDRVLSTGISQGLIDDFPEVRRQAESIAHVLGSTWALNVQGRVVKKTFLPFEVNPRHSGTTFLRALAGFNEPDLLLQYCFFSRKPKIWRIRRGYYLRNLGETFIPLKRIRR